LYCSKGAEKVELCNALWCSETLNKRLKAITGSGWTGTSVLHKQQLKEHNTCSSAVACLVASSASKSCRKEVICAGQSG